MKRLLTTTVVAAGLLLGSTQPASAATRKPSRACLSALDHAEDVQHMAGEFADNISTYFDEVQQSANRNASGSLSGVTTFLQENTASIQSLTGKLNELYPRMQAAKSAYDAAAAKCRAGR